MPTTDSTTLTCAGVVEGTREANILSLPNELLDPILSDWVDNATAASSRCDTIQEVIYAWKWEEIASTCRRFKECAATSSKRTWDKDLIAPWGYRREDSDPCEHFSATLQYTDAQRDKPYPPNSAVIVTDLFSFFLGTNDLSLVQSWIDARYEVRSKATKSKTRMYKPRKDDYSHGWCPPEKWNSFIQSSRNTEVTHLIICMLSIWCKEGSIEEQELQEVHSRNVEVLLSEVNHQMKKKPHGFMPKLVSVTIPTGMYAPIRAGGEMPQTLYVPSLDYFEWGFESPLARLKGGVNELVSQVSEFPGRAGTVQLSTSFDPCVTDQYFQDDDDNVFGW